MTQQPGPSSDNAPGSATVAAGAGLGRRLLARLLDALLVYLPASLLLAILGLPAPTIGLGGLDVWARSAVTAAAWLGYFALLESGTGTTVGKRLMQLQVVTADGERPSLRAAVTRNAWILFGLIPLIGGVAQLVAVVVIAVTIAANAHHRGKHDELAGTAVTVRAAPR